MRLTLVRHGETIGNRKGIIQGQTHGKLTIKGVAQAKRLGSRLKKEKFDIIYASDLRRAVETAKQILRYHPDTHVVFDPRIRERSLGEFEGKKHEVFSTGMLSFRASQDHFRPRGGESRTDMKRRVKKFITDMKRKHPLDSVLVVTHGGVIFHALLHLTKISRKSLEKDFLKNTSVTVLLVDGDHTLVALLNCDKHLRTPNQSTTGRKKKRIQ